MVRLRMMSFHLPVCFPLADQLPARAASILPHLPSRIRPASAPVISAATIEEIVPARSRQAFAAITTVEGVVAFAAVERVIATVPGKHIVAGTAAENIFVGAAFETVVSVTSFECPEICPRSASPALVENIFLRVDLLARRKSVQPRASTSRHHLDD
jgi:hypothetical protein